MSVHAITEANPRLSIVPKETLGVHQPKNGNDTSISFEEYHYWAEKTRADERLADQAMRDRRGPRTMLKTMKGRFAKGDDHNDEPDSNNAAIYETSSAEETMTGVSEKEWKQASRALRTATWGSIFYLITTDVLGPFSTPWAFAQMGYGPGVALYTVFGGMAG